MMRRRAQVPGSIADPDTYLTPGQYLDLVGALAGGQIDLDPATTPDNPVSAREWYSLANGEDGLALPWRVDRHGRPIRTIWCNPPYSAITPWVAKAIRVTADYTRISIWMLVPASTGTRYGQLALQGARQVLFVRGRISFRRVDGTVPGPAGFSSMLLGFGAARLATTADVAGIILPGGATAIMEGVA